MRPPAGNVSWESSNCQITVRQKIADPRAFPSARQVTSQSGRFVTLSANQRRRAQKSTNQSALYRPCVLWLVNYCRKLSRTTGKEHVKSFKWVTVLRECCWGLQAQEDCLFMIMPCFVEACKRVLDTSPRMFPLVFCQLIDRQDALFHQKLFVHSWKLQYVRCSDLQWLDWLSQWNWKSALQVKAIEHWLTSLWLVIKIKFWLVIRHIE